MKEKVRVNGSCKGGINCICNRNRKRKENLKRVAAKVVRRNSKVNINQEINLI